MARDDEDAARTASKSRVAGVDLIQDISAISSPIDGYLRRYRHRAKIRLGDGTRTDAFVADYVDRDPRMRDAIAVAIFARPQGNRRASGVRILLRRQMRYAAYLVTREPMVTEVVAGLIERPESPEETAVREIREETGIEVDRDRVRALGPPFFPIPGILTERMYPQVAEVEEADLERAAIDVPLGDGPMEQGAEHLIATLGDALRSIDLDPTRDPGGLRIEDAKTELVLWRLYRALDEGAL